MRRVPVRAAVAVLILAALALPAVAHPGRCRRGAAEESARQTYRLRWAARRPNRADCRTFDLLAPGGLMCDARMGRQVPVGSL